MRASCRPGIAERLPITEAGRARDAIVDAALVGMPELIDAERVVVELGRRRQVPPDRVAVGTVRVRVDEVSIELVEPEDEASHFTSARTADRIRSVAIMAWARSTSRC